MIHIWGENRVSYWHPYGLEFPKFAVIEFICDKCGKRETKTYEMRKE